MTAKITVRWFPSSDAAFGEWVQDLVNGAVGRRGAPFPLPSADHLQEQARRRYPACVIRPRHDLAEVGPVARPTWYAYRDGTAFMRQRPSNGDDPTSSPG